MLFNPTRFNSDSQDLILTINNHSISKVTSIKFLGLFIDGKLEWNIHIQDVCKTLRTYVSIFYKLSLRLPTHILRMLYFALVHPKILYSLELYANTYTTHLHDLEILNNRILRNIQHKTLNTNKIELYKTFNT